DDTFSFDAGGDTYDVAFNAHIASFDPAAVDTLTFTGGAGGQFSDFFQAIFGNMKGGGFGGQDPFAEAEMRGGPRGVFPGEVPRGADQEAEIEISLAEAYHGISKPIELESVEPTPDGGLQRRRKSYEVRIPKGATAGSRIRLAGQGGVGIGGAKKGDLYLKVRLRPDPRFEVEGHDLRRTVDITPWEAALGGDVSIETLDGSVRLSIPAGSQSGKILRLRGRGLPQRTGKSGDMLVRLRIVVPTTLSEKERALFEKMSRESSFRPESR
ncbi:J domain-containing protein, partial [bacterium]|nr:J domain-containing protein [bacterium]